VLPAGTPEALVYYQLNTLKVCQNDLRVWPELVLTVMAGEYLSGFDLYGIPIGESRFVKHPMSLKIAEVAKEVREVLEVLPGEGHAIWTVLRSAPS
jgi:hypothetical protein